MYLHANCLMMMKTFSLLALLCLFLCSTTLEGQNIVLFENPPPFTGDCITLSLGDVVLLEKGAFCGDEIGIVLPDGVNILTTSDTTIVLDQSGEYQILCNTPGAATSARTFEIAACIIVSQPVVPTLGEWGLIVLALFLMIFSVAGYRTHLSKSTEGIPQ